MNMYIYDEKEHVYLFQLVVACRIAKQSGFRPRERNGKVLFWYLGHGIVFHFDAW